MSEIAPITSCSSAICCIYFCVAAPATKRASFFAFASRPRRREASWARSRNGRCRWIAWSLWAHVVHHYPYDISWGGPHWVNAAHSPPLTWPQLLGIGAIIGAGVAIAFTSRLEFGKKSWAAVRSKT